MRRLLERKIGLFPGQKGFTLMEVLIALFILGALGAAMLTALQTNAQATRTLDEKVQASNLAADYLEKIRNVPYAHSYPTVGASIPKPPQYTVTVDVQCSVDGTTFRECQLTEDETFQKINVIVSHGGRTVLSLCTYRSKR